MTSVIDPRGFATWQDWGYRLNQILGVGSVGILPSNVALLNRDPQTFTGANTFSGNLSVEGTEVSLANSAVIDWNNGFGQLLRLWGTGESSYGFGIESATLFSKLGGGATSQFRWYNGEQNGGTVDSDNRLMAQLGQSSNGTELALYSWDNFAAIRLYGDAGNVSGEPGGGVISFHQDGDIVRGAIGIVNNVTDGLGPGFQPLTGAAGNSLVIATDNRAVYIAPALNTSALFSTNGNVTITRGYLIFSAGLTNAANDGAAASAGVPVNGLYRNGSVVQIRVT